MESSVTRQDVNNHTLTQSANCKASQYMQVTIILLALKGALYLIPPRYHPSQSKPFTAYSAVSVFDVYLI